MMGYTPTEWKQLREGDLSFLADAATAIAPFSGLSSNALAHLRKQWITWEKEYVRITVPEVASCNSFKLVGGDDYGYPAPLNHRKKPCYDCKALGDTDKFQNHWQSGPDGDEVRSYTAILHRDLAEPAVDFLNMVFRTYDRDELAVTQSAIATACRKIEKQTDGESYSYSKLQRTGPVLYAHYGLSAPDIVNLTPYTTNSVRQIVQRTPGVNFHQHSTLSFLKTVHENEPVTVETLMEELDRTRGITTQRLNHLKEEGKVEGQNTHHGPPAATWQTVEHWATPFKCNDCEFKTRSLTGIRTHQASMHGD